MKSMRELPKKYNHILLHVWRMWDELMLLNSQNASAQAKSRPPERGTFCTSKYSKIYSRISPVLANCVRKFAVPDDTWESSRCVGGWKKYQKIIEAINRPVSEASVAVCYRCREYRRKSSHTGRTSSPPLQPLTYVTFAFFPRETVSLLGSTRLRFAASLSSTFHFLPPSSHLVDWNHSWKKKKGHSVARIRTKIFEKSRRRRRPNSTATWV